ncbi:FimV/HubP family polar landmark protein, partial [Shewanella livingstonensis]
MTLRTSYIVGLIACTAVGLTSVQIIESAHAETLKITGPNGEVKQQAKRQYGPTTSRDTFWSIAQKVRPSDKVSVYQVMAALYDANPHAFSGNNYNTLERGMILLVPSADVMAAIPNSVAKRRAEQDDRRVNRQTQPRPVVKPIQPPIVDTPKKPTAAKPLQIAPQTPAIAVQTKAIKEANAVVVSDLNNTLDEANAKTLMLTDELARSQDELMISNNDNQTLKNKIEQMSLNISSLEEDLQLLQEKYDALSLENKKLLDQTENIEPVVEEPADFWRSLMDNTILLILAASIPLLAIFGLIFWLLSRRSKKAQQSEAETETKAEKALDPATDSDDSDDMVIHLDSDNEESIDDLLDLDSVDLQPEIQMSGDAEMDMASDMFIGEQEAEDEEGTSLDDLWAEAMDEQDSDLEPLEDDDDLDSLLAGLDDEPAATLRSVAPEDDLDSLLAGLDSDDVKDDIDALDTAAEDDIDSLLAEFDMPAESSVVAAAAVKSSKTSADDDIDSLLAEFDMPAESDDADVAVAAKTNSPGSADSSAEDDIDSLLAEFDMPA